MDVDKLISEVFVRSPLWDQTNKNHHNRYVLDKLWDEVASNLKTTRVTVRNKWKALRDKFRTTLASFPKPKSGDPAGSSCSYKGQWIHFETLLFLKDQFTPRMSEGNFKIIEEAPKEVNKDFQNVQDDIEYLDETECQLSLPSTSIDEIFSPKPEIGTPSSSRPSSSAGSHLNIKCKKRKRAPSEDIGSELLEVEKKKRKYLEEKKLERSNQDDDLNFFRSLLPYVNKLSPFDKMSYRMKILKVTQDFYILNDPVQSIVNPNLITISNNSATQNYMNETGISCSYENDCDKSDHLNP